MKHQNQMVTSAAGKQRRLCFVIWNFEPMEEGEFRETVDTAKRLGFSTIRLHLSWFQAERTPRHYQFAPYDRQIAYIARQGMDVVLTVDLQRREHVLDGERVCTDTVVPTDEFQYPYGKDVPYLENARQHTLMFSFASKRGVELAVRFYRDTVDHFVRMFGETIYAAFPTFTPYCETEYWCGGGEAFDYSPHMQRAFHRYLTENFLNIHALNEDLGTVYQSFSDIPLPAPDDRSKLGILFYQCRQKYLATVIERFATAHRDVAPSTKFAVQFGCVWDGASARRCTYGFAKLSKPADLVVVDDDPLFNHAFSMDYVASALCGTGKAFGNEIDGGYYIANGHCTAQDYIDQGLISFRHNATVQYAANWFAGDFLNEQGDLFRTISDAFLENPAAECVSEKPESGTVRGSLRGLWNAGNAEKITTKYERISGCGAEFVRVNMVDDLTTMQGTADLFPHSIAGKLSLVNTEEAKELRHDMRTALMATTAVGMVALTLALSMAGALFLLLDEGQKHDKK